jgi:hypothetical protein
MDKKYIHGSLAVDGNILQEFKDKFSALQRRLKSNQFNPDGYELMNDRQQDVFITGIFVDPMQAEGIDNYIEFGYDNCECPDVMDELYDTCPALMSKVDKFKDRKDAQTRVTIEYLDRMMDMVTEEQLTKKPLLAEGVSEEVQAYEQRVIDALAAANIQGPMPTADANSNGPDAIMELGGPHIIEIKLGAKDQMGYSTLQYRPNSKSNKFKLVNEKAFDEKDLPLVMTLLSELEPDLRNWVEAIVDPRYPMSSQWVKDPEKTALGFNTTLEKYMAAADAKFQYKANRGLSKATRKPLGEEAIAGLYASKKTHYIQIGPGKGGKGKSMGLYYLKNNPANLPVPQFKGVTYLETRVLAGGRKKTGEVYSGTDPEFVGRPEPALDPRTGEVLYTGKIKKDADPDAPVTNISNKVYKAQFKARPAAKGEDGKPLGNGKPYVKVGGSYALTLRFDAKAKGLEPSPYTLDEAEGPRGIKAMLAAMPNKDPRAQRGPAQQGAPDLAAAAAAKENK